MGCIMLALVVIPTLEWQLLHQGEAPERKLVKPTPLNLTEEKPTGKVLANDTQTVTDLTKAHNWFPKAHIEAENTIDINEYYLSIPKLKILNAHVLVGGEDLDKSLIHYKGTAIPGNYGNSVIFGHSVLPTFFNPQNYHTIFSTLPTMKVGDEIIATVDQVEFRYTVFELRTIAPSDISVLEQEYDDGYLSLITCVPPGLDWKRLVVRSRLNLPINAIL